MVWDVNDPFRHFRDEDVLRMADRLSQGEITDEKAEWLARAQHRSFGWAGRPVPFDETGQYRPEGSKERDIDLARRFLEKLKLDKENEEA